MPTAFLVLVPLLALVVALAAYGIGSARRARYADRRGILAEGGRATGAVVAIAAADRHGRRRITIEFTPEGGRPLRVGQPVPAAVVDVLGLAAGAPLEVRHRLTRPRLAFAPALVCADYTPAPTLAPSAAPGPALYVVAFEDPDRPSTLRPQNAFGWTGGELVVDDRALHVRAVRARPFRRPAPVGGRFPLEWIQNVEVLQQRVSLEIVVEGTPNAVLLWTVDADTAADLARRLPATRSARYAPVMAEAAEFHRDLLARAPTTPVTLGLVAANLLAFVLAAALFGTGWLQPEPTRLILLGSNYTPLTVGGQWWRLLTNTFLHFGVLHVAFNMWALYVNGPLVERLFGGARYLLVYLVAGVGASLASLWWHPLVNSAGASGAIFGVFGAMLAFFTRGPEGVPASVIRSHRNSILQFIVLTLLLGVRVKFIDHAAHLGGLVVGFVLGYALARPVGAAHAEPARERQHALGLALAAAALVAVAALGGPTTAAISATVAGGIPGVRPHPTLTGLAGIRLGDTRDEVRRARGDPRVDHRDTWLYDLGEPGQPAVLDVTFHVVGGHAAPDDRVGAVFYRGDKSHAPPELLYVTGQARTQFVADFGQPAWLLHAKGGIDYEMYADGLTVELEHGRARAYGVQDYYRTLHE